MGDFFQEMQRESKAPATHENYARRSKAFSALLKRLYPECWNEDSTLELSRVTTKMICKYIAVTSQKDGKLLSFSTAESNRSAIIDIQTIRDVQLRSAIHIDNRTVVGFCRRIGQKFAILQASYSNILANHFCCNSA